MNQWEPLGEIRGPGVMWSSQITDHKLLRADKEQASGMIAFERTHTSKRSILSLHSKNRWPTNIGGTLRGCGIPRDPEAPRYTGKSPPRAVAHICLKSISVYMFIDKLRFLWNVMGSEFIATSEREDQKEPWLALIDICTGTITTIKPVFWHA